MTRIIIPLLGMLCFCATFVRTCDLQICAEQLRTKTTMDKCCSKFKVVLPKDDKKECDWSKCKDVLDTDKDPCCIHYPIKEGKCPDIHTTEAQAVHHTNYVICPNNTCRSDSDCSGTSKCCKDEWCGEICREVLKEEDCDWYHHTDDPCKICRCEHPKITCERIVCPPTVICDGKEHKKILTCCAQKCHDMDPDH